MFPIRFHSHEAKYPVPVEQGYAATKWVAENGQTTINVNPSRIHFTGLKIQVKHLDHWS
jgi:acetyl esterase/lipase